MPISLRLSPDGEQKLDEMVKQGRYKDRSAAIRAGLTLLKKTLEARAKGRMVVSIDPKELGKRGIAWVLDEP